MDQNPKRYLWTLVIVALLLAGALIYWRYTDENRLSNLASEKISENTGTAIEDNLAPKQLPVEAPTPQSDPTPPSVEPTPVRDDKPAELPKQTLISMPFTSQAPFGVWDELHNEACEEAALLMVKYYRDGKMLSKNVADQELRALVGFETNSAYAVDISLAELSDIANDYYAMKTGRIVKNLTVDQIKNELVNERPVIVGAAGKQLGNPNFRNGGPNYHMLVIKGYDSDGFITNDPGTRNGEGYKYTFETLIRAIHDWNPSDITQGEKNYLVFD